MIRDGINETEMVHGEPVARVATFLAGRPGERGRRKSGLCGNERGFLKQPCFHSSFSVFHREMRLGADKKCSFQRLRNFIED